MATPQIRCQFGVPRPPRVDAAPVLASERTKVNVSPGITFASAHYGDRTSHPLTSSVITFAPACGPGYRASLCVALRHRPPPCGL